MTHVQPRPEESQLGEAAERAMAHGLRVADHLSNKFILYLRRNKFILLNKLQVYSTKQITRSFNFSVIGASLTNFSNMV